MKESIMNQLNNRVSNQIHFLQTSEILNKRSPGQKEIRKKRRKRDQERKTHKREQRN